MKWLLILFADEKTELASLRTLTQSDLFQLVLGGEKFMLWRN